jgi:hypothetical protein
MKTVVISSQRITVEAHEAIKKKAEENLCEQQVIIRKILHEWALKQNHKQAKKGN